MKEKVDFKNVDQKIDQVEDNIQSFEPTIWYFTYLEIKFLQDTCEVILNEHLKKIKPLDNVKQYFVKNEEEKVQN